jgi:predicted dehydrogenase
VHVTTRTGVLLVGLGQIGLGYDLHLDSRRHVYSHARAFSQHPRFELLAGVDPDASRRQLLESTYGCPAYEHLDSALRLHPPEMVIIAGPTPSHGETLRRALAKSAPRVILCEKPLSYDLSEARTMVQACADRQVQLYVNYVRRSDPGVIEVKRRIDSGEIGTPAKGVAWYSKGFLHNGSHIFNLLEHWLGPMESAQVLDPGRLWGGKDPEPDARVMFSKGTVVFMAVREEAFSHYAVELLTANGRLRYDRAGGSIAWQATHADPEFQGYTVLSPDVESIASGRDRYQWHVAEQLAAAIDGEDSSICSGSEALTTLEGLHTIIQMR